MTEPTSPEELPRHPLDVPYEPPVNPHRDAAAAHNIEWLRRHGMLASDRAVEVYQQWRMDDLVARTVPDVDEEGLKLATNLFGFFYLFDDQFDSEIGVRPAQTWEVCRRLVDIAHGDLSGAGFSPVTTAFADVWTRLSRGRSPGWLARAVYNWEEFFASYPNETIRRTVAAEQRAAGGPAQIPSRASYLRLRRGASGSEPTLDSFESIYGIEVAPAALHSPELRLLRQYSCDIPTFSNDVYSYTKEVSRGEVNNLVLVVQSQKDYALPQASADVFDECRWMLDQCERLSAGVPMLCRRLGLSEEETASTIRYAKILTDWAYGYPGWEAYTMRYRDDCLLPFDEPNYVEDLLAPKQQRPFVVA